LRVAPDVTATMQDAVSPTLDALFRDALAHQQAGRFARAEALCDTLLAHAPDHLDAQHLRGVLAIQTGRHDAAITLLEQLVARAPTLALAHKNLGAAYHAAGRPGDAEPCYRRALARDPGLVEAHNLLGQLLNDTERPGEALPHLREAMRLAPRDADAANNLGNALQTLGDLDGAITCYHAALIARPALAIAYSNLGSALQRRGHLDAALANYRAALSLAPDDPLAHGNLAGLLGERGDLDAALMHFERSLSVDPRNATILMGLGSTLYDYDRIDDAIRSYQAALALRPNFARARLNLGLALLKSGDFARGWAAYAARWDTGDLDHIRRRIAGPRWEGDDPAGRTILLYGEQGLGDLIQFCRYAPLLAARGARVVLLVDGSWQPLHPVLTSLAGVAHVADALGRTGPYDCHASVLDLPRLLGTTLDTIPADIPYLAADPARRTRWRAQLGAAEGLRVGLVWAGGTLFAREHLRSPRLAPLLPLLALPGIRWFGLQKGDGRRDLETCAPPPSFTDLGAALDDWADTAAVMDELDLVISSCTAPAHLAGALGRPLWLMLPSMADWRWLADRADSPWYPTARLFRQARRGDWSAVVERLIGELSALRDGDRSRLLPG
jgi:tetratricopeptide (TPR) repeat protein